MVDMEDNDRSLCVHFQTADLTSIVLTMNRNMLMRLREDIDAAFANTPASKRTH